MKNKGRSHKHVKHVNESGMEGSQNTTGLLLHITRPIRSMSSRGFAIDKFDKKKWSKRVRGYFKSQTKNLLE